MAKRANYGTLSPEESDYITSQPLSKHALRLAIWICGRAKTANRLKGKAFESFTRWHEANAQHLDPKAINTVQFTHRQAATLYKKESHTMSGRYINELIEAGVLKPIRTGTKGFATLYLVCPVCTHSWECANDKGDLHTPDRPSAHFEGVICTRGEPLTCSDKTYPVNIPIDYPASAPAAAKEKAAQPLRCPECGSSDSVQITEGGLATCACGTAWKV